MAKGPYIMVIGTECPPEIEKEFNEWYSNKHIPEFMQFKGVNKATRYKVKPLEHEIYQNKGESAGQYPEYVAIYEIETWEDVVAYYTGPERIPLVEDWNKWAEKGARIKWRVFYEPFLTRQK